MTQDKQITKTLKAFGLDKKQATVYLTCLQTSEELTPYKISKITKIPRTTVYDVLMDLSFKGLIELDQSDGIKKQQTLVKAKNPTIIRDIIQRRRKDLTHLELDILNILPDLKQDFHKQETSSDFQYFPGIEGAKRILSDYESSKIRLPLYRWDRLLPMDIFGKEEMQEHIAKTLSVERSRQAETKILTPLNDWTKHVLSFQFGKNPEYLANRNIRYIDNPTYDIYLRIEIIGNYLNMVATEEDEIWGMKIKSKALAQTFKSFFQIQWLQSKRITAAMIESWGENEFLKQ